MSKSFDIAQFGIKNTEKAFVEVSTLPSLDIAKRLHYLIHYPYGCSEQLTSGAFAQLYLSSLIKTDEKQKKSIKKNIQNVISSLQSRQHSNGGIKYWPGDSYANDWITTYVGQFLWEAKEKAYFVPNSLFKGWLKFQKKRARKWTLDTSSEYERKISSSSQAYRLYVLALTKNANVGAMNRLRENKDLSTLAKWHLAGAYALIGKQKIATLLTETLNTKTDTYNASYNHTFGSRIRDKAMILEVLRLLHLDLQAHRLLYTIAEEVNKNSWMSTQTTAFVFSSIGKILQEEKTSDQGLSFSYSVNGKNIESIVSHKPIHKIELEYKNKIAQFDIHNQSDGILYVRAFSEGKPIAGEESISSSGIALSIRYNDLQGKSINPKQLTQGTDFVATVSVQVNDYSSTREHVALSTLFPPGWEIINTRMSDFDFNLQQSEFTYQDIRDDRVYTFFNMNTKRKTFKFLLHAAYEGTYYFPSIRCEAMYDHSVNAGLKGSWIEVIKK